MSEDQRRKPSAPSMTAFAVGNGNHPPPRPPTKRPPEVVEQLLETTVAKLESLRESVDKLAETTATKEQVQHVYEQARRTHRLLEQHIQGNIEERKAIAHRQEAIMGMLAQVLERLPEPAPPPPRAVTLPSPPATQLSPGEVPKKT